MVGQTHQWSLLPELKLPDILPLSKPEEANILLSLFTPYSKGKKNVLPRILYVHEEMWIYMWRHEQATASVLNFMIFTSPSEEWNKKTDSNSSGLQKRWRPADQTSLWTEFRKRTWIKNLSSCFCEKCFQIQSQINTLLYRHFISVFFKLISASIKDKVLSGK